MCIAHNNCMSCPSIWATLSALLINILLGSFQLFLHSDQPLSEGEIIPFSGVCQSGEAALSRRRRWWLHARPGHNDVQPTTTSGNIITQSIIFNFGINNSFVYFASGCNITLTHLHVSNCRVRQLQFSGIFVAGLCR